MFLKQTHIWPEVCPMRTNSWWEDTHWVWDVADSVHPDIPRYRKCVDPVQWDFVLEFQQVGAVYRHLWAKTGIFKIPAFLWIKPLRCMYRLTRAYQRLRPPTAQVRWPWRRRRAPGRWSRRGPRVCRAAGGAFPLCPSSPAAGSYTPHRAGLWSEGWSGGRRQSAAWCCSRSTGPSEICREGCTQGLIY